MNNYLPIGSIVKIKESDAYLMIIGYDYPKEDKVFDYVAVIHLAGIGFIPANSDTDLVVFNRSSIEEVSFIGYMDREARKKLKYMEMMKEGKK